MREVAVLVRELLSAKQVIVAYLLEFDAISNVSSKNFDESAGNGRKLND